jgi:putative membrane protein
MELYPIVKALHIISMTAWMAGMFYLPRLLAYHAAVRIGTPEYSMLRIMESRLLRAIMNPAMLLTWGFGLWLVAITGYGTGQHPAQWLTYKLTLVLTLSALHGYFAGCVRRFAMEKNARGIKFYKVINEMVTVIFIGIVLLVVIKPF